MKIWTNTNTLAEYHHQFDIVEDKNLAQIALLGSKKININEFPNLLGIFRAGIGKDNVPEKEANENNIKVCYPTAKTIEIIFNETSSFTCNLIFKMMYNNIGTIDPWMKSSRRQLQNKNLLVIGTGNIGRRVFDNMKPFLQVNGFDLLQNSINELDSLLKKADCITLHIPSIPQNKSFLDKEKLKILKKDAILINTSRGMIVDENDLFDEFKNDRLYGSFDVFWEEPYDGILKKFLNKRFFMTPHVASTCREFLEGCVKDLNNFILEL